MKGECWKYLSDETLQELREALMDKVTDLEQILHWEMAKSIIAEQERRKLVK